jgi:hypothetical protein
VHAERHGRGDRDGVHAGSARWHRHARPPEPHYRRSHLGPDGNVWFSDGTCTNNFKNGQGVVGWCAIGKVTPSGQITEYPIDPSVAVASNTICGLPGCTTSPGKLVVGADGNIWYVEGGTPGGIGRVVVPSVPPPVTTPPPPVATGPVPTPVLSLVKQSHPIWKLGNLLAIFTKKPGPKKKPIPVGTKFSFTLNESATVTLTFTQLLDGRRVKGKCIAPTAKNKRKPHCQRQGRVSVLTDSTAHAGANAIAFEGKLPNSSKLKPGKYEFTIAP